jgi:hypothetical protein
MRFNFAPVKFYWVKKMGDDQDGHRPGNEGEESERGAGKVLN